MRYHPPQLPWVTDSDFAIYQNVVANAYRYHDAMLGALLNFSDENTTVILLSDHGFHPDHLRPGYIPAEPAGPAVEHRHFGMICLKGPGLLTNQRLYGASLLDICPTILTLFGLPPGKDMDGQVLVTAFKDPPIIEPIESWDRLPGDSGTLPPDARVDSVASAQAFKQLVDLGYVAPPGANAQEEIQETLRELKYNLARAYRDGNCCGEAAALAHELWTAWPKEHRFGILLLDCLEALGQVARRRTVLEELGRRIERYQAEAAAQLAVREKERSTAQQPGELGRHPEQEGRFHFEERQLRELANGRPLLIEWFHVSQALLEKRPAEARHWMEKLAQSGKSSDALNQRIAGALAELGDFDKARELLEKILESDPENTNVHSRLATMHFKAGRFESAIASASESLSLLYFQPGIHALLGRALMKTARFAEAEQEFRVAVAQSPLNQAAHAWLGQLYRQHLDRPAEAFAHEGRAVSIRNEQAGRLQMSSGAINPLAHPEEIDRPVIDDFPIFLSGKAEPFGPEIKANQIITIVSGLPRSGTSMMMQLLTAAGREPLTDSKRVADEDNPMGYFEFEKAIRLATDVSWIPQARGKVVKIVAQLLSFLPLGEHYQVIFMQRNLSEVVASQNAMLTRRRLRGADLNEEQLQQTYIEHLKRVRTELQRRPEIRALVVNYSELLAEPEDGVSCIGAFIGEPFDSEKAIASIRPQLRRQKN